MGLFLFEKATKFFVFINYMQHWKQKNYSHSENLLTRINFVRFTMRGEMKLLIYLIAVLSSYTANSQTIRADDQTHKIEIPNGNTNHLYYAQTYIPSLDPNTHKNEQIACTVQKAQLCLSLHIHPKMRNHPRWANDNTQNNADDQCANKLTTNQERNHQTHISKLPNGNTKHIYNAQKHILSLGPNAPTANEYKLCAHSKKHSYNNPRTDTRKCVTNDQCTNT